MVKFKIQLANVIIRDVSDVREVPAPVSCGEQWQVNGNEYSLKVKGIGSFYVRDGREVEYYAEIGADPDWVRLYLNGQVLVALLHQRKIISFHASSFVYDGRGVMILGESGAGKSSLTAAFVLKGDLLLTDDVTPVVLLGSEMRIMPLHGSIRIRKNTAEQLNLNSDKLREAEYGTGKQYLLTGNAREENYPLQTILKIEIGEVASPEFSKPTPADLFSYLRSEICLSEILPGMPETEAAYFKQMVQIINKVQFVRVVRPAGIAIKDMQRAIEDFLKHMGDVSSDL
ncbi:MAG: hypothetical protein JXR66_08490 [Bacteroidales bacterium]|nr:hypothetical protein [Bacteroidales bacterium]